MASNEDESTKFYDALLLFAETDYGITLRVQEILEKFVILKNKQAPKTCLGNYDYFLDQQTLNAFEKAYNASTYVFVVITENFHKDAEAQFLKNEFIARSIRSPDKKWRVVPLFTTPRNLVVNLPFGLQGLRGLDISLLLKSGSQVKLISLKYFLISNIFESINLLQYDSQHCENNLSLISCIS